MKQSLESRETVAQVADRLGVGSELLSKWRRTLTKRNTDDPAPVANQGPDKGSKQLSRENQTLKKKLKRLELENEILKKAQEHFAKLPK